MALDLERIEAREKYEDARSLNQDLTFTETALEFSVRNIVFGDSQIKSLKLATTVWAFCSTQ